MSIIYDDKIVGIFEKVINYARNLFLVQIETNQMQENELYTALTKLKLFLLIFDTNVSVNKIAKTLYCGKDHCTGIMGIRNTLLKLDGKKMPLPVQLGIHFLALDYKIDAADKKLFFTRCVSVLNKLTEINYFSVYTCEPVKT